MPLPTHLAFPDQVPPPPPPPSCTCRVVYHLPDSPEYQSKGWRWSWTVLPRCKVHWSQLTARRRAEILTLRLYDGWPLETVSA